MAITYRKMVITGGAKLKGRVKVSGSKNATLPIMAAALLSDEPSIIKGVPMVRDIKTMAALLKILGAEVFLENNTLEIRPKTVNVFKAPYDLVKTMRASIYVLGPLLTKYKKAKVSLPGCAIGLRPIDLHIKGMEKLGAKIELKHGYVVATAKRLKGARIVFDKVSLGATVNVMLAAVLAEGTTVLENASIEPEITETVNFLKKMGAKISGAGTATLIIEGVKKLKGVKNYRVIPDRIEAATLVIAGLMTKGRITVENVIPSHLSVFFEKLKEAGARFTVKKTKVEVYPSKIKLKGRDIITEPYPGFPTDIQAQWMALMTVSEGGSVIKETIWENRFMHVLELARMGADIRIEGNRAFVMGVKKLTAADVMASDLRASAALILAGLAAAGRTYIRRIYHLDRGYENLDKKLIGLGAKIRIEREAAA